MTHIKKKLRKYKITAESDGIIYQFFTVRRHSQYDFLIIKPQASNTLAEELEGSPCENLNQLDCNIRADKMCQIVVCAMCGYFRHLQ